MSLPLSGITVVSLEQAIAAPLASRHLADWGARVIKVERPDGGDFARAYDKANNGLSSQFLWANRSKESVALDLKTSEGRDSLERILSTADVWVQNLAPGAAARMELDGAAVLSRHPGIVAADLSGYGSTGPYRDKKAYDLLVQCEAGFVSINGSAEQAAKCGLSIVDIAGGMALLQGILMGLLRKARTGAGLHFETSLFDAIAEWMSYPAYYAMGSGAAPERSGLRHATIAPYGPFRTGDDKTIFFGIQNQREWRAFCSRIMQDDSLADMALFKDNPARLHNHEALRLLIEKRLAAVTADEALALLDEASIANAQLNDVEGFIGHPQLVQRGRFAEVDSAFGPQRVLLPSLTISGVSPVMKAVPAPGQHTAAVLAGVAA
ncbi:CoA transferase [Xylophilus rhododendri]|uniref:CoA transferase n=1 Tax=Xylophilus rhododendri TaxID=2697032 RepID=A0A857J4L7_9BURK|nr:CaiB/BaiF CoA-transferase family protein [Xylophilus rhododendri]QHI98746.1 CoA transferase [Xylophilus rhododendri]